MTHPILSPTRDNDEVIVRGVLTGVQQAGARYGLTMPRRELLAWVLSAVICSIQEGREAELVGLMRVFETGRPSQQGSDPGGDATAHLTVPEFAG